jgi:hypothetical protein
MWPLIKRIPSLPKSISSRLTALFPSSHSKASRLNKSNSTERTVVNDDDATNPDDRINEVNATSWHRPSDRSAKHLTYRSEAEGYGAGSPDDIELLGAEKEYKTNQNDSTWIDEIGREQLSYPFQYPAALLKD